MVSCFQNLYGTKWYIVTKIDRFCKYRIHKICKNLLKYKNLTMWRLNNDAVKHLFPAIRIFNKKIYIWLNCCVSIYWIDIHSKLWNWFRVILKFIAARVNECNLSGLLRNICYIIPWWGHSTDAVNKIFFIY